MAIKGKRRTRTGGRTVAVPPRRPYVPPPKPLFRRTGVRASLALFLVAAGVLLTVIFINTRNANREREQAQQSVREFQDRVSAALTAKGIGQQTGTGFLILPEFGQIVSQLQTAEVDAKEVKGKIDTWIADVNDAATKIASINTGTADVSSDLTQISNLFRQSLLLYAGMSKTLGVTVGLKDKAQRDALAAGLLEQYPSAAAVFDAAWQRLQELRTELGIPQPVAQQQPGGIPGGVPGGIPGGVPGGIPGGQPGFPPVGVEVPSG